MDLFKSLIITAVLYSYLVVGLPINDVIEEPNVDDIVGKNNLTGSNKDLYVVHAVVYQAGIITNKSEDELNRTGVLGNQEAVTFYNTNGSGLDLSTLPSPLVSNVTAQRVVGVAPVDLSAGAPLPWAHLDDLVTHNAENAENPRQTRDIQTEKLFKRSLAATDEGNKQQDKSLEKGEKIYETKAKKGTIPMKTLASLPPIIIPPLQFHWINTSISEIPTPIVNTTVSSSLLN